MQRLVSQFFKHFCSTTPINVVLLLQEEVMTLERILLQTIRFDLQVEHPYGYLIKYAKSLKGIQMSASASN